MANLLETILITYLPERFGSMAVSFVYLQWQIYVLSRVETKCFIIALHTIHTKNSKKNIYLLTTMFYELFHGPKLR
jgi:hypothetical protein